MESPYNLCYCGVFCTELDLLIYLRWNEAKVVKLNQHGEWGDASFLHLKLFIPKEKFWKVQGRRDDCVLFALTLWSSDLPLKLLFFIIALKAWNLPTITCIVEALSLGLKPNNIHIRFAVTFPQLCCLSNVWVTDRRERKEDLDLFAFLKVISITKDVDSYDADPIEV